MNRKNEIIEQTNAVLPNNRKLSYYLTESYEQDRKTFSITVEYGGAGDRAVIHDVCSDKEKAVEIFNCLSRGTVTPCCAAEVIEDILSEDTEIIVRLS